MAIEMTVENPVDRMVYERDIYPWLPPKIFDLHVHVYLEEHIDPISAERRAERWPMEIAKQHSFEEMRQHFQTLFPRNEVGSLVFGYVTRETHIEENNEYVLAGLSDPRNSGCEALFVTRPQWHASEIDAAMDKGFIGIKPYPDLAPQHTREVSIHDFLPDAHLEVIDRRGGIVVLHIPRAGRLADPDNIKEILDISERYPNARIIIAHVGRAYCMPTVERGLPQLLGRENLYFDITANLNPDVIAYTLRLVGPDRVFYGSDLPVMLMRGVREYEGENYINYTDGPYSWNKNRKSPEEEAQYTYYLYEELKALIQAVRELGLGKDAIHKVMYGNAMRLLGKKSPR